MKKKAWINIVVFILGCVSGSSALQAAQAANPPINWGDIPLIFCGSALGVVFVLTIQVLRRDSKWARRGIDIFMLIIVYVLGAGVAAAAIAVFGNGITPASLLFLLIGVGLLIGLGVSSMLVRWKFK